MKMKIIFCLLFWIWSAGWICAAAQSKSADSAIPLWSVDNVTSGRTIFLKGDVPFDRDRAGLTFIDNNRLLVYEVDLDRGKLPSRKLRGLVYSQELQALVLQLHVLMLDANSGKLLLTKEWETHERESAVYAVSGGVLLRTGDTLRLLRSANLAEYQEVVFPSVPIGCMESVSPSQKTILLSCFNSRTNISNFDVLDGSSLKAKDSWSESPGFIPGPSISDAGIVAYDFFHNGILLIEFGSRKRELIGNKLKWKVGCQGRSFPISDDHLIVQTCNNLYVLSTAGRAWALDDFKKGGSIRWKNAISLKRVSVAQDGRSVAIIWEGRDTWFGWDLERSMRLLAVHAEVYDLLSKKRVLNVEVAPLPKNEYDLALSPDGSKLAILNDRTVLVYAIPHE